MTSLSSSQDANNECFKSTTCQYRPKTPRSPRMNNNNNTIIQVVVVEPHHHALEHIHQALREQRRLGTSWSLCHIDAHPDLACPSSSCSGIPAVACFRPRDEWNRILPSSYSSSTRTTTTSTSTTSTNVDGKDNDDKPETSSNTPTSTLTRGCLYEMLDDSTTGISEWIIPLVLAGGLNRIEWVKPKTAQSPVPVGTTVVTTATQSSQFPLGIHHFRVGVYDPRIFVVNGTTSTTTTNLSPIAHDDDMVVTVAHAESTITSFTELSDIAVVKVNFDCLYYRDDDADDFYCPTDKLVLAQPLELHVTDWSTMGNDTNDNQKDEEPWILDICLDYFYCVNPFLADMEIANPDLARLVRQLVADSCFYQAATTTTAMASKLSVDREGLIRFRQVLRGILERLTIHCTDDGNSETPNATKPQDSQDALNNDFMRELEPFYDTAIQENVRNGLVELAIIFETQRDSNHDRVKLRDLAVESLAHIMLPHSLPKSTLSNQSVEKNMEETVEAAFDIFEKGLRRKLLQTSQPPFLITMARSMQDGFTPPNLADTLQQRVQKILHKLFCGDDCKEEQNGNLPHNSRPCQLEFVIDYE